MTTLQWKKQLLNILMCSSEDPLCSWKLRSAASIARGIHEQESAEVGKRILGKLAPREAFESEVLSGVQCTRANFSLCRPCHSPAPLWHGTHPHFSWD